MRAAFRSSPTAWVPPANPLVQIPCFKKAPALATLLAVVMHLVQGMIVPVRSTALAHKATCHGGELHNVAMMQRSGRSAPLAKVWLVGQPGGGPLVVSPTLFHVLQRSHGY
jgi:hypothetical protein